MKDLTVLFLTLNRTPERWARFQKKILQKAARDYPLISISAKPMNFGTNIIQDEPPSASNIYKQMLRGAKVATTPFVAVAEDDVLYVREHFDVFRPRPDEFAYNGSRWGMFTWGEPTYFWADRVSNLTLIAPRELLIQALEERFAKYPNGTPDALTGELGRVQVAQRLGLKSYKLTWFHSTIPVVYFCHDYTIDPLDKNHRKRRAFLRAYDIPHWGRAEDLQKKFI